MSRWMDALKVTRMRLMSCRKQSLLKSIKGRLALSNIVGKGYESKISLDKKEDKWFIKSRLQSYLEDVDDDEDDEDDDGKGMEALSIFFGPNEIDNSNDDDDNSNAGENGNGLSPFLRHTFATPGEYIIGVAAFNSENDPGGITGDTIPVGQSYRLHISLDGAGHWDYFQSIDWICSASLGIRIDHSF